MKILVTGGAGFIASHLVDRLIEEGHYVIVVDNFSAGRKENVNPKASFYKVDICDSVALEDIFKKEGPEIVDHHAAHVDVRKSVEMPVYDANINILGSLNLCELSKNIKSKSSYMFQQAALFMVNLRICQSRKHAPLNLSHSME